MMGAARDTEAIVVGAGVIGLAVARALARAGREVVVLERETAPGTHTSARNSEVIHAGIYYPPGSQKARLCVAGRRALYDYAAANGVAHRRLGKLIVATAEDELAALQGYCDRALANGVEGLRWLEADQARALEPEVRCVRALFSAETGIIDSHGLMLALRRDLEAAGGTVVLRAPVLAARAGGDIFEIEVGGAAPTTVRCDRLVNAAGPWAPALARAIEGLPPACVPAAHFAKGHYFTLAGPSPFSHLVYPVATGGGLGIHVTLDLAGRVRFGPDVEWVDGVDYAFDESRAPAFEAAIRRYWPGLPAGALRPGYTGVRPKLGPAGSLAQDFLIQGPRDHGVGGLINLFGIESPGLTAALALADEVAAVLDG
jgi:L-2-hydroxyglutarate oxidase LhgO